MTTLVINNDGTADCVIRSECERKSAIQRAEMAGLMWCASSKIPDPQNPAVFLRPQYRLHFKRKPK